MLRDCVDEEGFLSLGSRRISNVLSYILYSSLIIIIIIISGSSILCVNYYEVCQGPKAFAVL